MLGEGVVNMMTMQDMGIEISSEMSDIFGGDGLYALDSFISKKDATFKFTEAKMSMNYITASQGSAINEKPVLFIDEVVTVGSDGTATLSNDNIEEDSIFAYTTDDKGISTAVAFTFDSAAKTIKFTDADLIDKKVTVSYRYGGGADASGTTVKTVDVPGYYEIRHKSQPVKQKDNTYIVIYTTIYKARCDGSLNLDFKRMEAFAPELSFKAVDPEREDEAFVSFSVRRFDKEPTEY